VCVSLLLLLLLLLAPSGLRLNSDSRRGRPGGALCTRMKCSLSNPRQSMRSCIPTLHPAPLLHGQGTGGVLPASPRAPCRVCGAPLCEFVRGEEHSRLPAFSSHARPLAPSPALSRARCSTALDKGGGPEGVGGARVWRCASFHTIYLCIG